MTLNIHSNLRTEEGFPHNQYSSSLIVQSFFLCQYLRGEFGSIHRILVTIALGSYERISKQNISINCLTIV